MLQWLESSPNEWPVTEKKLISKIKEFCVLTVNVSPEVVVNELCEANMIEVENNDQLLDEKNKDVKEKIKEKMKFKVLWNNFDQFEDVVGKETSIATITVMRRVMYVLKALKVMFELLFKFIIY